MLRLVPKVKIQCVEWLYHRNDGKVGSAVLLRIFERAHRLGLLGARSEAAAELTHSEDLIRKVGTLSKEACLDLGSGCGLPGLVMACYWPFTSWTLLDRRERCGDFLRWAVSLLEVGDRVEVLVQDARHAVRQRASSVDFLVARAFAKPLVTARTAAAFVRQGGRIVVTESPQFDTNRWSPEPLAALGLRVHAFEQGPPSLCRP